MGIVETIAITMGIGWASGFNLYAAMLTLGLLGATDSMVLPEGLLILQHPAVIAAAAFMYFVEFFADKTPGVDTAWDTIHTFIRIPAGAVLAAMAVGDVSPVAETVALIVGGGMAASAHATKAGTRMLINTSPEPFSNWTASVAEDVAVVGGLWLALASPELFLVLLAIGMLLMIWLLPKIWRGLKAVYARIRGWLGGEPPAARPAASTDPTGTRLADGDASFALSLGRGEPGDRPA